MSQWSLTAVSRARLRVRRRLAEPLGHRGVGLRGDDVVHPHVHAVRVLGLGRDHPGVRPAGRALLRAASSRSCTLSASSRFAITCQVVPTTRVAAGERRLLLGVVRPVLADVRALLLEQVDRGVELLVVELVDVVDPQVGLGRLQVQRRVGDVDRAVVGGDLALVRRALVEDGAPESGAGLTLSVRHISRFAPRPCGMPYICAVDRVERLVLQAVEDVGVVRRPGRC